MKRIIKVGVRKKSGINIKKMIKRSSRIPFTKEAVLEELVDHFGEEYRNEISNTLKLWENDWNVYGRTGIFKVDGKTYNFFLDEDEAEEVAFVYLIKEIEDNPDLFNTEWLASFLDENRYLESIKTDIWYEVEENPEVYSEFIDEEPAGKDGTYTEEQIEKMVDNYIEDIKIRGVVNWLKEDLGYGDKEIVDNLFFFIDKKEAAKDALRTDGWLLTLGIDDYDTTENGLVIVSKE